MSAPFFAAKHANLKNDYSDGSGICVDSCSLIATEMAKLLKTEDKNPRIIAVHGEKLDSVGNTATLLPTPFEGRIKWGAHVVCEAEGLIYDPMMDSVLPKEDYVDRAFDQPVELKDCTEILNH